MSLLQFRRTIMVGCLSKYDQIPKAGIRPKRTELNSIGVTSIRLDTLWAKMKRDDDVVSRHTLPVFTGLGRYPIASWDFAGAVSIFVPDALPVVHQ